MARPDLHRTGLADMLPEQNPVVKRANARDGRADPVSAPSATWAAERRAEQGRSEQRLRELKEAIQAMLAATVLADDCDVDEAAERGKLSRSTWAHAPIGSLVLTAITPAQIQEVVSLLDQLSQAREARAEGSTQLPDEIFHDPQRWKLTDYLYSLSGEAEAT